MTPAITRLPGRCQRSLSVLLIGLLLAAITLAGCDARPAGEQPTEPAPGPRPAGGSPTPVGDCGEALSGLDHSAEGPGSRRFEITRQELEVIGSRLVEVFCRQGLWRQDVGFGVHYGKDPTRVVVLISPGRSGLTARQILDRLLGRG